MSPTSLGSCFRLKTMNEPARHRLFRGRERSILLRGGWTRSSNGEKRKKNGKGKTQRPNSKGEKRKDALTLPFWILLSLPVQAAASSPPSLLTATMSVYENVVAGKLKLKGKALDVKAGGVKKKKKHHKSSLIEHEPSGVEAGTSVDPSKDMNEEEQLRNEVNQPTHDDHLTPAERKYIEQRARIDTKKMAKNANKSHRDRIQYFNEYLADLSEHYDIPKVGPG